ncbi:DDB1- and CUL4-associated factor 7 homolog [Hippocampus zosterae]|uniref:DDB1- and CUL4-associated factor 7 homolog n=1 Tax=Hippocampus zosterae TaxID=109293 RepID=UPI00223D6088|nr:DDB1- and CUL4-associated factor 7 homolog [Hippocampus zosterae]
MYTYQTENNIYAKNVYEIIQLNPANNNFERNARFEHDYSANKVMWYPSVEVGEVDLLATSGEKINIWQVLGNRDYATCAIWDCAQEKLTRQLLMGVYEVYDICFSADGNSFAQVGGDGALRQYDLRSGKSTQLFRTDESNPIVKLAWNRRSTSYIGLGEVDKLEYHKDYVNALCWAPHTETHICSVGDDKLALIWDLKSDKEPEQQRNGPLLEYVSEDSISNLCWSLLQNEWLAISSSDYVQILKV